MKTNNGSVYIPEIEKENVLIYDIETATAGPKPDATKDELRLFGFYSYKIGKSGIIPYTDKKSIQKLIDKHKFLVGFNNEAYDDPILKRSGISLEYKRIIDLRKIIKGRAGGMITKKGMLGKVLMKYSLDYITRFLDIVDENSAKDEIDYAIFKKKVWTKDDVALMKKYTIRDIEITKKLYEWIEDYFVSFKDFVPKVDVEKKYYLTDSIAKFAYKAICHALGWEPVYDSSAFKNTNPEDRISGGYVAYPAGERFEGNLVQLDFSSLYPHIMIQCDLYSRNKKSAEGWHGNGMWKVQGFYDDKKLSPVCELLRAWYFLRLKYKRKFVTAEGKVVKMFDKKKGTSALDYVGQKYYRVKQNSEGHIKLEISTMTEESANEYIELAKSGIDRREYTVKIIINTIYGLLNNAYYALVYDLIAGGDCTRIGRQWTKHARKLFREAGYKLLYSDSVSKDSIVCLENGKDISIEEYWNTYTHLKYKDDKEWASCSMPILTCDDNYKNIYLLPKRIIRHKTKKKMYKIMLTNEEELNVTEDHSLITICPKTKKLISVKPSELKKIKYVLQKHKRVNKIKSKSYMKELYFLMGNYVADGNLLKQKISKKYNYISLSGKYILDIVDKIIKPLQKKYNFNITYDKKPTDIVINSTFLAELFYNLGFEGQSYNKIIPDWLKYETEENISMFIKGYFTGDGGILIRNGKPIVRASSINKNLLLGIRQLFEVLGYRTSIFSENKKTHYKGKISKYNMIYLNVLDKYKYLNNIGFLYEIDYNCKDEEEILPWFGNNDDAIKPSSYIKKHNRLITSNMKQPPKADFSLRNIVSIETYYKNDYVYDFSIDKYERFYANNILVHNTDSWYFEDVFDDKARYLKVKEKVIADIKNSVPFPQVTFDADIDSEMKYMFFFKSTKNEEKETDSEMDEDDIINKPKGLMKKNYIYVTKDNKVKIKNLGISKKNISALSKEIFWKHIVPVIISEGRVKFSATEIENLMRRLLTENVELAYMRKEVSPLSAYSNSKTGIQAQIAQAYGPGIHFLIPNKRNIGIGKKSRYCTVEEFKKYKMEISDIDFSKFWSELNYFIKERKQPTLFDWQ